MSNVLAVNGNIGKLEKRTLQSGDAVVNFSVASKTGKDKTTWFNCSAFGKTAEFIEQFFKVGSPIHVVGQIESRKYTNKEGVEVTTMDVSVYKASFSAGGKKEDKEPAKDINEVDDQSIPF